MTTAPRSDGAARVRAEHIITFEEAARLFPVGRQPAVRTLLRWAIHGRGKVRLDEARVEGEHRTSVEAVRRFREKTGL